MSDERAIRMDGNKTLKLKGKQTDQKIRSLFRKRRPGFESCLGV
jgi:hypothetical protein